MDDKNAYREIPRVDKLLEHFDDSFNVNVLKYCINKVLDNVRLQIKNDKITHCVEGHEIIEKIKQEYDNFINGSLKKVVNATGTILHTNLGRSPISRQHYLKAADVATAYSNLEFDLLKGARGNRYAHVAEYITYLTGREASLVVNNNAAAVFFVLNTFCKGGNVIISRGELVEIGGSFRIPEVMKAAQADIKEVGTTNKTKLSDYENAIDDNTKMILKVHRSNFKLIGFTEEVMVNKLAELAGKYNVLTYYDLGSGLFNNHVARMFNEPCVIDGALRGVDLISFSGDKLLGSVQAGIIAGKKSLINKLRGNQLLRMLRVDKLTLAMLQETMKDYIINDGKGIPILQMILESREDHLKKCKAIKELLEKDLKDKIDYIEIKEDFACIGGGSCPEEYIESYALFLSFKNLRTMEVKRRLLEYKIPIIVRVSEEKLLINPITLLDGDINIVRDALRWVTTT